MTEEEGQDEEGVRSDVARSATTSQLRALFSNKNVNTLNTTGLVDTSGMIRNFTLAVRRCRPKQWRFIDFTSRVKIIDREFVTSAKKIR